MKRVSLFLGLLIIIGMIGALVLNSSGVAAQGGSTPTPGSEGGNVTYTWAGDVNAPDFPAGKDWINTTGPITMADLRGKIVLLDFWTYGCINCIHIIPDLKRLEKEYSGNLVVIGVHSAKFDNESRTENIRKIVQRYEIDHPVINDTDFTMWQEYGVQAWPTVMVIDPFGKVVGQLSGEPLYSRIQPIIDTMVKEYGAAGVLNTNPIPQWSPESMQQTPLLFPGKVLADPTGNRLFISDSNHNRIVVVALDTYEVLDVIGSGTEGLVDGDYTTAEFFRPQGLALDGNTLYVADTENHAIRAVDLNAKTVKTVAGTGKQAQAQDQNVSGPGPTIALNSPWDLVATGGKIYIAMAGPHQLWVYDPTSGNVSVYAGSGGEGLDDGKLSQATMAQPSGIDTDGKVLYFTDPEASAVRTADLNPDGSVKTIVGTGLFDFGDKDGTGNDVLLQHPLGITVADDGYLYIADTYNSKIKRIDPATRESVTYAGTGQEGLVDGAAAQTEFYEPGGIDFANGKLYVADTNNNAIRVIDMAAKTVSTIQFPNQDRLMQQSAQASQPQPTPTSPFGTDEVVTVAPQTVAAGEGTIRLNVIVPEGYAFNDQAPFTAIWQQNNIVKVDPDHQEIRIVVPQMPLDVPVTFSAGQTDLNVNLTIYWCEEVNQSLCFVKRVALDLPLTVVAQGGNTANMEYTLVPPNVNNTLGQ